MLIDTHTHVAGEAFDADRDEVLRRAKEAGVEALIAIGSGYGFERNADAVALAKAEPDVYAAVGVHPHEAEEITGEDQWTQLRTLIDENPGNVVCVGEIGLDYYYDNSPREKQREVFARALDLAAEVKLPISIHNRSSNEDLYDLLVAKNARDVGGVIHCFTENYEWGKKYLDLGFKLSIPGIITFKNAGDLREAVRRFPVEALLVETDCPFLAPIPYRGKRNEPAYVTKVAETIAQIKAPFTLEDVARITTQNAIDLFGLEKYAGPYQEPQIAYPIRNSLYLNITNRCSNPCVFCPKFDDWQVKGHYLRLGQEPGFEKIVEAIAARGKVSDFDELVFVGFGEPTIALDMLKKVARWAKENGVKRLRLDTDGLGNLYHGRNIVPELAEVGVTHVNVSLNGPDRETYNRVTRTPHKEDGYDAVKAFILECKKHMEWVQASVVTMPGVDVEASRAVAEDELGVLFRGRDYEEGVG